MAGKHFLDELGRFDGDAEILQRTFEARGLDRVAREDRIEREQQVPAATRPLHEPTRVALFPRTLRADHEDRVAALRHRAKAHRVEVFEQHQLITARDHGHARRAVHGHLTLTDRGQYTQMRGADAGAGGEDHLTAGHVFAARTHIGSALCIAVVVNDHLRFTAIAVFDTNHSIGTGRHGRAGHDAHGRTSLHPGQLRGIGASHARANHGQDAWHGARRPQHITPAHGIAVHSGIVPRRQRQTTRDILRQCPTQCRLERHPLNRGTRAAHRVQNGLQCVVVTQTTRSRHLPFTKVVDARYAAMRSCTRSTSRVGTV